MRNPGVSRGVSPALVLILVLVLSPLMVALVYAQAQKPVETAPASGSPADALREQIVAQERAGLDALETGDLTAFGASTADDAIFVDAHGSATKAEVMEQDRKSTRLNSSHLGI